jgi:hypothetical protein
VCIRAEAIGRTVRGSCGMLRTKSASDSRWAGLGNSPSYAYDWMPSFKNCVHIMIGRFSFFIGTYRPLVYIFPFFINEN